MPHVCHSAGTLREEADDPEDDPAEDDPEDDGRSFGRSDPPLPASTTFTPARLAASLSSATSASSSSTLDPDAYSSTRSRSSAAMASSASCCAAPALVSEPYPPSAARFSHPTALDTVRSSFQRS